ncbi:hypothetical protein NCER_100692 [Vairimorpha ceranae BRL01]|uniref:Uncharacterized protein n=2 Tax=Vairimorpha ceranae TaxID=40302 RepID=C4V884_VAIC1|nr:ornithine decarboxylase [Vairimorpha ceranae]EEQ82562.1 hypothetical protein NCER_100692 [Vairimorpha ceranae BRL01]KAF5140035.1 hypothetical protein G9O61_00g017600 [Vairimorpha ceranae]KKO75349.1 ornithine decarboxylase [Vairimorpha ceranae]
MLSKIEKNELTHLDESNVENDELSNSSHNFEEIEEFSSSCEQIDDSNEEAVYFGDENIFLESSEKEEAAWCDSESDEDILREKYQKQPEWLNSKKFKKVNSVKTSQLKLSFTPGIFKTNFNIKLLKYHLSEICLVDTMNIIYILDNFKLKYTIKLDKWSVSDITYFNNKIHICNNKYNRIKKIINGEIRDINKIFTRNINKLISYDDQLYILGDTTVVVNGNLEIINESFNKLVNLISYKDSLLALSNNGDILQFSKDLQLVNKMIYKDKFCFTDLIYLDHLVVVTKSSAIFIDDDFKYFKELNNVSNIIEHKDYYFYFTSNGLQILNKDFTIKKHKNKIKPCKIFINTDNMILLCSYRELHNLIINTL